jgi:hypothetical protein
MQRFQFCRFLPFAVLLFATSGASADSSDVERVSVASDGTQGNGGSFATSLSGDGRFVAFLSDASNLVADDTNHALDVFVRDRQTGTTERVSVASDGTEGDFGSDSIPSLSADGRFVAFDSYSTNLVPGDTNNRRDAFVRDRQTGTTERVSVASDGTQGNGESRTDFSGLSADGRFVVFVSDATNLIPDDTNNVRDVFVRNRQTGTTERVSVASDGTQGNGASFSASISGDGRFVIFASTARNLVPNDTNGAVDVFVRDRQTGTTERVSVASDGTQGNTDSGGYEQSPGHLVDFGGPPVISPDGRFAAFVSNATNLDPNGDTNNSSDVFVRDRYVFHNTLRRTPGCLNCGGFCCASALQLDIDSDGPIALSSDGSIVAFHSLDFLVGQHCNSGGIIGGSNAVFIDEAGFTADASNLPTQGNGMCGIGARGATFSADGRYVAFWSYAPLVTDDTNDDADAYVRLVADVLATTTSTTTTSITTTSITTTSTPTTSTTSSTSITSTTSTTHTTSTTSTTHTTSTTSTIGTTATTSTATPTTSTTRPCDRNPRCALDATASGACAGETVPTRIISELARAATLEEQIPAASGKRAKRLVTEASRLLKAASKAARKAGHGRMAQISPECAGAIAAADHTQRQGLRAP